MIDDITTALARARREDLQRDACRAQLVRLATCCKPSVWASGLASVTARLRRDPQPQGCCA